jgi:hypothetical protein
LQVVCIHPRLLWTLFWIYYHISGCLSPQAQANLIQNSELFVVKFHLLFLIITRRAAFLSQFLPSR